MMTEEPSEKKVCYPEIYVRGKAAKAISKLPEGEFEFVAKGRVVGWRKPTDGQPSADIEIMAIKPMGYEEEDEEEDFHESAVESFRTALSQNQGDAIGQSG